MAKKKRSLLKLLVLMTLLSNVSSLQKNADALIKTGVGVGTTGVYIKAGYYLFNTVGVLAEYSNDFGVWNKLIDKSGISRNMIEGGTGKLDINTKAYGFIFSVKPFAALLPVPFLSAMHIDAGMYNLNYNIGFAFHGDDIEIGNHIYSTDINGEYTIAKGWKPYIGLGFDFNPFLGLTIDFSAGVFVTGDWKVRKFEVTNAVVEQSDIDKAKMEIEKISLPIFPVVKLGIGYQFNI